MKNKVLDVALVGEAPAARSLSPTSASAWRQCELKFALAYLYGWRESGTLPQLIGNTAHKAIEVLYGLPGPERLRPVASELLREAYDAEVAVPAFGHMREHHTGLREQVLTVGEDCLDGLFELEDPRYVTVGPDGLEVWVRAELYGAPINGKIDRIYDASGAYVVADYKSGATPKSPYRPKAFFGLWTYAAALAASDPDHVLPDRIELLYLVGRDRLARPVLRDVALEHAKGLARDWRAVGEAVRMNVVQARTGPLCNWCAFAPACPAKTPPLRGRSAPAVGSAEHEEVLAGLGLTRRRAVPAQPGGVGAGRDRDAGSAWPEEAAVADLDRMMTATSEAEAAAGALEDA